MNDQLLLDVRLLSMTLRKPLISDILRTGSRLTPLELSFEWAGLTCPDISRDRTTLTLCGAIMVALARWIQQLLGVGSEAIR